jgi:ATP-binding cassette subfamily F protein uup
MGKKVSSVRRVFQRELGMVIAEGHLVEQAAVAKRNCLRYAGQFMSIHDSTPVFSANSLIVRYGVQTLLDSSTLALHEGERVGLVGRNGCGKSTFLRIAAGDLEPDGGEVTRKRNALVGWLPQDFALDLTKTVEANVLDGAKHIVEAIHEYENVAPESNRAAELLDEISHHDGWNIDNRLATLLDNLHAPAADRLAQGLSGGEKRRVALCRALISQPDLLILDEPTNHLDNRSVQWLEDFLRTYEGTLLFVTHDRYFLDRVSTRIVELRGGKFFSFPGNYQDFLITKASREANDEAQESKRQKFLASELEWVRKGPSARRTKSVDRIERYHELAAQEGPQRDGSMDMIIPPPPKLGNIVLDLKDVGAKVGDRVLFDHFSYEMPAGARVGLVGRNGIGKTTLLKVIMGQLEPMRGKAVVGARTVINYIDQNREVLREEDTVMAAVAGKSDWVVLGEEKLHVRSYLRRFLFTDEAINSKVHLLSGGERSRLALAKILLRGGNLLIFDEPTNDLDLSTLQILEEGIATFTGCALVVSHDRWFLNRICTHILAFEDDGRIDLHVGDYDRYLEKRKDMPKAPAPASKAVAAVATPVTAVVQPAPAARGKSQKARKLTYKEKIEFDGMETAIHEAEAEATTIEKTLSDPEFFVKRSREFPEFEARLEATKARIANLYARWQELEEIAKAAGE